MPETDNRYLFFESDAVDDDTLLIASLTGAEELSRLFRFRLELLSRKPDLDYDALLRADTRLAIKQGVALDDGEFGVQTLRISGVLTAIEQRDQGADWTSYEVELQPHLWRLSLAMNSRIFIDKTVPEIVEAVLQDAGFTGEDYELRTEGRTYPPREFAVQHCESDLDFIQRLCEHEGIAYLFEHDENGTTLVFIDAPSGPNPISGPTELSYLPQSEHQARVTAKEEGASAWFNKEVVNKLVCRQKVVPERVVLQDYNWRTPQQNLRSEHEVEAGAAFGTHYEYGNHYKNTDEGAVYARIRAEEAACMAKLFVGASDCRSFRAGATFTLAEHYRADCNREYVLLTVDHVGSQEIELESGGSQLTTYSNTFQAIPAETPFRPPRRTPKPRITGTINARVDASSQSDYAELDDQGRYKVMIPYDLSGRGQGQASRFIRMAQPYAGADMGMHFPLHAGTEVLLTHVNGDPDRPIIAGAVPNPDTGSPVAGGNQTQGRIRTGAGMEMVFEDTAGTEQIRMFSPHAGTQFCMGGPGTGFDWETGGDWKSRIGRDRSWKVDGKDDLNVTGVRTVEIGSDLNETIGGAHNLTINGKTTWQQVQDYTKTWGAIKFTQKLAAEVGLTQGFFFAEKLAAEINLSQSLSFNHVFGVSLDRADGIKIDLNASGEVTRTGVFKKEEAPVIKRTAGTAIMDKASVIDFEARDWRAEGGSASLDMQNEFKLHAGSDGEVKASGRLHIKGNPVEINSDGAAGVQAAGELSLTGSPIKLNNFVEITSSSCKIRGSLEIS